MMSNEPQETEWMPLSEAAKLPEVSVTSETLRQMIMRGEVPEGHWMSMSLGESRKVFYIDKAILPSLNFKGQGERGKSKKTLR